MIENQLRPGAPQFFPAPSKPSERELIEFLKTETFTSRTGYERIVADFGDVIGRSESPQVVVQYFADKLMNVLLPAIHEMKGGRR